jgi:hypothetical protein
LLSIFALLSDPSNQRTIVAIAGDFCFADASSFGRAFRLEFGYSPGDVRSAAKAGIFLTVPGRTEIAASPPDSLIISGFAEEIVVRHQLKSCRGLMPCFLA